MKRPTDLSPESIRSRVEFLRATDSHAAARMLEALAADRDRLSADLALIREALDRYAALDPDGARAVLAQLGGEQSERPAPDLRAALAEASEALEPFAKFAAKAEAFVESRAAASNDASGIMAPTRDFRLRDFVRARDVRAALAKLAEGA